MQIYVPMYLVIEYHFIKTENRYDTRWENINPVQSLKWCIKMLEIKGKNQHPNTLLGLNV